MDELRWIQKKTKEEVLGKERLTEETAEQGCLGVW